MVDNMNLGSLEVPQERKSAMFFATLFWREPDLQIYNRAQWSEPMCNQTFVNHDALQTAVQPLLELCMGLHK